jgi:hypothetical protein
LVFLLAGCQAMEPRVPNFPKLDVTVNEINIFKLQYYCYGYVPLGYKLLGAISTGCAEINFSKNSCTVYVPTWAPDYILEHELEHCAGGDHNGRLQQMYDNYLRNNK